MRRAHTSHSETNRRDLATKVSFVNTFLGITPTRDENDAAMARLAATLIVKHISQERTVDIGTGAALVCCRSARCLCAISIFYLRTRSLYVLRVGGLGLGVGVGVGG